jgi:hypothetical protein
MEKHISAKRRLEHLKEKIREIEKKHDLENHLVSEIEAVRYKVPEKFGIEPYTYTQSKILPFEVIKIVSGAYDYKTYIVKEYEADELFSKKPERNYKTEKIIYPIIQSEGIFGELAYFEDPFLRLYLKGLMLKPLNKLFTGAKNEEKLHALYTLFEPLKKCFSLPEERIQKIKTALADENIQFKKLDGEYYERKFADYLKFFEHYPHPELFERIKSKKNKIIDSLTEPSLYRPGLIDLYPRHCMGNKFIDAEGLSECSMGLPFGCSFGNASIYNHLPDKNRDFSTLLDTFLNGFDKSIDSNKLKDASYSGAIFGNLRQTSVPGFAYKEYHFNLIKENLKAIESQLEVI